MTLLAVGVYHILFAFWTNAWPFHAFDLLNLAHPNHPILWRTIGLISGALGLAFVLASRDPVRNWTVVLVGLAKSLATAGIVGVSISSGDLPLRCVSLLFVNDLVWIIPFALILWGSIRAHAGIPLSRSEPYSLEEAATVYSLSSGETLLAASTERPIVLVFLRHFGCTFTRQILRGLQDLESQAKQNGATLVLVHMLRSGEEINYLGQNSDIPRIADPRCELYRAFGLGKGGFMELFGPYVWWRGAISIFKGCGTGHLAGDGLQMPGAFVMHRGKIIHAQPAHSAADLPDLSALFQQVPVA